MTGPHLPGAGFPEPRPAHSPREFVLADVFTDRLFGGNQLAVFPDARGLSEAAMQELTREFNFSETTFVLPPEDPAHTCRLRIFTPAGELPFAGHPTVGTAAVLAARGADAGTGRLVFEEGIGPIEVEVSLRDRTGGEGDAARRVFSRFTVTAPLERAEPAPEPGAVAAALSLAPEDLVACWYAGIGVHFCYVRLSDRATVDRAVLDRAAWAGASTGRAPGLYVFAGDFRAGGHLYARSFVPSLDAGEDPATGSACAGLVASLATSAPGEGEVTHALRVEQGVLMGRPSLIEATARTRGGRLESVSIGGATVLAGGGTIEVPVP
ncbi:PhzF family phenazine biosynthesis protein [Streptomyces hoynatensis]|nr:PhzF family phenazine biosynthesis protein [Streptomyces hoynatensis]